jgi:predicted negative regulator of RcsB-dependent stress response
MQDEEQVEALKRWWDENGRSTVVAVGLAIAGTLGWQQYQSWEAGKAASASDQYAEVLRMRESQAELEELDVSAELLKAEHGSSTYAAFAAMQVAATAVSNRDYEKAEQELRWVMQQNVGGPRIIDLAALRLARVLAASGAEEEALTLLASGSDVYPVAYAMAIGDIHLVAGRDADALLAYQQAEGAALLTGSVPALLETKIDTLTTRIGASDTDSGATS